MNEVRWVPDDNTVALVHLAGRDPGGNPEWVLPWRTIPDYEIIYVYTGEGTFFVQDTPYPMKRGSVVVLPPDLPHRGTTNSDQPMAFLFVHFEWRVVRESLGLPLWSETIHQFNELGELLQAGQIRQELLQRGVFIPRYLTMGQPEQLDSVFEHLVETYQQLLPGRRVRAGAQLYLLLGLLSREVVAASANLGKRTRNTCYQEVAQVALHLREHLTGDTSLPELARMVGLSPDYLGRQFRRQLGVTPLGYVRNLRMERAQELLRDTNDSIEEVSLRVGYQDPNYFSRIFHQMIGMSPLTYRRVYKA